MIECVLCGKPNRNDGLCSYCGKSVDGRPYPRLMSGNRTGDIFLGFLGGTIMYASLGTGIIIVPVAWLFTGKKYPGIRRGLEVSTLFSLLVLLTAIAYSLAVRRNI